ncbi:MAG: hypothetical protein CMP84_07560 [Gammaproteobacteria bacterium]|nr:hypothetical protein [Gammaproteobacteria bacterium]
MITRFLGYNHLRKKAIFYSISSRVRCDILLNFSRPLGLDREELSEASTPIQTTIIIRMNAREILSITGLANSLLIQIAKLFRVAL